MTGSQPGLRVYRVALDVPMRRVFDYLPPESAIFAPEGAQTSVAPGGAQASTVGERPALAIHPGTRVRAPFGRQKLVGVILEEADSSDLPAERLKPILEVLDPHPILDPAAQGLLRWAADYYHHPIGEVLSAALPKALRLGASASTTEERWSLTPEGHEAHA